MDIRLKAKMEQHPREAEAQPEPEKGIFKSFFDDIKTVAKGIVSDRKGRLAVSKISLEKGSEYAEVYTEVTRQETHKVHANVTWKLKNTSKHASWSANLQLIPVMSSPTLRIHFESNICQLRQGSTGELKLKVRIPEEYTANHLIMLLKLRQGKKRFVGPSLLLFVKIIKRQDDDREVSSFAQDDGSDDGKNGDPSGERKLRLIA